MVVSRATVSGQWLPAALLRDLTAIQSHPEHRVGRILISLVVWGGEGSTSCVDTHFERTCIPIERFRKSTCEIHMWSHVRHVRRTHSQPKTQEPSPNITKELRSKIDRGRWPVRWRGCTCTLQLQPARCLGGVNPRRYVAPPDRLFTVTAESFFGNMGFPHAKWRAVGVAMGGTGIQKQRLS
jgi:hypothetical protein